MAEKAARGAGKRHKKNKFHKKWIWQHDVLNTDWLFLDISASMLNQEVNFYRGFKKDMLIYSDFKTTSNFVKSCTFEIIPWCTEIVDNLLNHSSIEHCIFFLGSTQVCQELKIKNWEFIAYLPKCPLEWNIHIIVIYDKTRNKRPRIIVAQCVYINVSRVGVNINVPFFWDAEWKC